MLEPCAERYLGTHNQEADARSAAETRVRQLEEELSRRYTKS